MFVYALWGVAMLAIAVMYNVWLNAGCDLAGAMTWSGKVCIF